ncbi:MAG TPA: CDP-alcohol phosphatidyltransferase family protein [Bauldia sp.]|nr:CDP-alcohol phosphatidyltransferase family protein [Bauldia sp.]
MRNLDVWAVHLLTASGAALALAAAVAASNDQWQASFLWLGIALIVDGVDGPFARRFDVSERLPWFDGGLLDFVIDYATYVFVPAMILVRSGLLAPPFSIIAGIVVAVVGALYFADTRMKTPEAAFRGFPAVWNVVVFQLMVYKWPEPVTLAIIAVFAVVTFTGVEFVHPVRVVRLRPLTLAMAALWAVLGLTALIYNLAPPTWVVVVFALVNAYFTVIGVYLQLTRPKIAT